jgi:ABC-2 type transport system ATP-binding protein
VYLNGAILGLGKKEIDRRFDEIVDFAGIGPFIDEPVKNYSSGMYVRLGFSVAINVDPEVLLVDEVLAVGDEAFQRKCSEKFADLKYDGKTIVLVSHSMHSVQNICDRVAWFEHGKLLGIGEPREIIEEYTSTVQVDRETDEGGHKRWGSGRAGHGAGILLLHQPAQRDAGQRAELGRGRLCPRQDRGQGRRRGRARPATPPARDL